MRIKPTSILLVLLVGLLGVAPAMAQDNTNRRLPTSADAYARSPHPVLRVPFVETPPTIDGQMNPGEWDGLAAYTGFWQDYGHNQFLNLAYHEKQATFWIGYDNDYLYVAHSSPVFPRGAWLTARGKYRDVLTHPRYGVLWDDHIEFQIRPQSDDRDRGPFFKWNSNPIDTTVDFFMQGLDSDPVDYTFDSGFEVKSNWPDDEVWITEMRIPLESLRYGPYEDLELPITDGTVWRHWTSRSIGGTGGFTRLFSAAAPGGSGGWLLNPMRLVFDSASVSAQLTDLGPLMRDGVDLNLKLTNQGDHSEVVRIGFFIENNEELILMNEEDEFIDLLPGETQDVRITKENIGVSDTGNALWIDVRTLSGKLVYRSIVSTFHHVRGQERYEEHFVDGMRFSRSPRSPFFLNYAYYPSQDTIYVEVDTDIYGADEEAQTAVEVRAVLLTEGGEEIADTTFALTPPLEHPDAKNFGGASGHGRINFEKLPEGYYKVLILLFDKDQRIVGDFETGPFRQMSFPWETEREGVEDTLWKPYIAMKWDADAKTIDTLLHQITLGDAALPAQIAFNKKKPALGEQLVNPVRFEASVGDNRFDYEVVESVQQTIPGISEQTFTATGKAGPVQIRAEARYEADGFLLYDLWYKTESGQSVDTLELVLDFDGPMDLFAYRDRGASFNQLLNTSVFDKEGPVVWNSRDDAQTPFELFYGNFLPYLFLGNGDRAFIWMCETDRGMRLLEENIAMQLEKDEQGRYSIRIFLVNEPGAVDEEHHVRFGLMTLPTKPKPENFRAIQWDYENIGHPSLMSDTGNMYHFHLEHEEDYALFKPNPNPTRIYTTSDVTSWHLPELRNLTYAGEFLGSTGGSPNPERTDSRLGAKHPVTGRPLDTIFHYSGANWKWSPAQVDSHVYWRSRAIRLAGVQGWWWDHTNNLVAPSDYDPVVGNAYDLPEYKSHIGGQRQYAFHFFNPRDFFKRMARIQAEHGVKNTHAHYGGVPSGLLEPFIRDHVHWEHSAGYSGRMPHMDAWNADIMRFYANNYTGLAGYIIDDTHYGRDSFDAGVDTIYDRSVIGNALLHDKGVSFERRANKEVWNNVKNALDEFGYFQSADVVEFIPYWRSGEFYQFGMGADLIDEFATEEELALLEKLDKVKVSIYRNTKNRKVLLVIGNYGPEGITENLSVDPALLGRAFKRVYDPESGEELRLMRDPRNWNRGIANHTVPIYVGPYQFRMIVIE